MRPTGSRAVIDRMADAIIHDPTERTSLPLGFAPAALAEIVVLSDLWSPIEEIRRTLAQLSASGSQGHLVQIVDPAEETFPYSGRIEFIEPEGFGEITAGRAENWRADYEARLARHRDEIRAETDRLGWSFTIHRTDRPANELLLALHARIGEGNEAVAMNRRPARHTAWEVGMMGLPLGFAQPLVLLGLLSLPVLWWLLRLIPPRPRRIEFPPTRLLFDIKPKEDTPARTPWWLTLLRLTLATLVILAAAGPLWNPPVATSTGAAPIALLIDDGWSAASTWDARMRTADDIARPRRGRQSRRRTRSAGRSRRATSRCSRRPRRVCGCKQIKPKPHAIERTDALPAITRLLTATPGMEVIWLSDGVDLGRGSEFVTGLARAAGRSSGGGGHRRPVDRARACRRRQRRRRAHREGAARIHRRRRRRRRSALSI